MKLAAVPESLLERAALVAGRVPLPVFETLIALLLARSLIVGTQVGIFPALAAGPGTVEEVAARCGTDPNATAKLLGALVAAGYLRQRGARYSLSPAARRWLLPEAPLSLTDAVLLQALDADLIAHMEGYVRTGQPVDLHTVLAGEQWGVYQRGMRSGARLAAPEVALRTPLPRGARDLLDIGGAHGYYSVALCRRHPDLRATVLDLPEAIEHAAPLLAREGMAERVRHQAGDVLQTDLGSERYDAVLLFNVAHHFDAATNRALAVRVARALRPGGVFVLGEVLRPESPGAAGQAGVLADLYFALTSQGGTYSGAEMAAWQREAGLVPRRLIRLLTLPGGGLQVGARRREPRPARPPDA